MLAELFNRRLRDHGEVDALHVMQRRAVDRVDDRGTGGAWRHRADRLRKHEVVDEEGALAWGKELGQPHRLEILIGGRGGVEEIVGFDLAAERKAATLLRDRLALTPELDLSEAESLSRSPILRRFARKSRRTQRPGHVLASIRPSNRCHMDRISSGVSVDFDE